MGLSLLEKAGKKFREDGLSEVVKRTVISPIKEIELLRRETEGAVSLGQGIPSFKTPEHIKKAAIDAIQADKVERYSSNMGMLSLRKAMAEKLGKFNKVRADPEKEILATVGAIEGCVEALLATINVGDEVIITSPCYSSHIEQIKLAGGRPRFVPLVEEEGWSLDIDEFRKAVNRNTKAIILNTPSNPTGAIFGSQQILEVRDIALEQNLFVITDETYEYFTYDGKKHFSLASLPEMEKNAISIFSLSKTYAMTGWRVGYAVAEEGIINQMLKLHDAATICCPVVSQYAALGALTGSDKCIMEFKGEYDKRRKLCMARLKEIDIFDTQTPEGAYYIMPKVLDGNIDSFDFAIKLLKEGGVATVPGLAFGPTGEGHIRLSFGADEKTLNEAFDRVEKFAKKVEKKEIEIKKASA